jgi:hypothetical protein
MSKMKDKMEFNPLSTDPITEAYTKSRCLDAMSLTNTFCVIVTQYKKGVIDQDDLYERLLKLYKDCDYYGFVNDK